LLACKVVNINLSERDFQRLADTAGKLSEVKWYIQESIENINDLCQLVIQWCEVEKIGLLILDDIHSVPHPLTERHNSLVTLNHALKRLAIEYDIPIIVTAQVSKSIENRPNKRPAPSDIHDSGFIEDIADVIMFIYRDEYYNYQTEKQGIAEIIIGKQRNGPVATVELQFHSAHVRFNDLAKFS
jgi:replicative DNA helicase